MSISSYCSPKTEIRTSKIAGSGRFAKEPIKKGEIIAIRSGHIVTGATLQANAEVVNHAEHQIADDFYLVPLTTEEFQKVMCFFNHACEPNVGLQGKIHS